MKASISFKQDVILANALLQLLAREQHSLVMGNVDEMEQLLENKSALLQEINQVAKSRYESLRLKSFQPNENGMLAWVIQQANPAMSQAWENFQSIVQQAKEMNRLNGILINKHFVRNQQAINFLQNSLKSNDTYGQNGQTKTHIASRGSLLA